MVIKMNAFGNSLVTRESGRAAYDSIIGQMRNTGDVTEFDFSGIELITNSFADEVFGRMAFEYGIDTMRKRTTFSHIDRMWAIVVRSVIDSRSAQRDSAVTA